MPAQARPLLYVIIVNLNGCSHTLSCLEALERQTYPSFETHLIDNGSTDHTLDAVARRFPQVYLHPHRQNLGFAAGSNVGLRLARRQGAYALLLNNDTEFNPDLIERLMGTAVSDPGIGLLSPKIYYADDRTRIWSTGYRRHPLTLETLDGHDGQLDRGQADRLIERDFLFGTALLIRPALLSRIGLLDERYFFGYEDLDYSIRAQQSGFRLCCEPGAQLWHKIASTVGDDSVLQNYHHGYSSVLFYVKHSPRRLRPVIFLNRSASTVKRALRLLTRRRPRAARAYLKGLYIGWRSVIRSRP